jgi:hypothetical protein
MCLALMLIPNDLKIPPWVLWIGLGANTIILIAGVARRRRKPVEKPE